MSPIDLAWQMWGARRRLNETARIVAWAVSSVMLPHVSKRDQSSISSRALFLRLRGSALDEDEVAE
jgi:hypothetical protein